MSGTNTKQSQAPSPAQAHMYQIRVEGHLRPHWSDWFDNLAVRPQADGNTLLSGPLADQAALYGLLGKIRDLGLSLVSVTRVEEGKYTDIPDA